MNIVYPIKRRNFMNNPNNAKRKPLPLNEEETKLVNGGMAPKGIKPGKKILSGRDEDEKPAKTNIIG